MDAPLTKPADHLTQMLDHYFANKNPKRPTRQELYNKVTSIFRNDDLENKASIIATIARSIDRAWGLDVRGELLDVHPFATADRHPFQLVNVPNRGRAYVSDRVIPVDTRIIKEHPLVVTTGPNGVRALPLLLLPKNALYHILHLHGHGAADFLYSEPTQFWHSSVKNQLLELLGRVLQTNAMQDGSCICLFRKASIFNHSENPNIRITYSTQDGQTVGLFTTTRKIEAGEELCHSYATINGFANKDAYHQHLFKQYGIPKPQ